MSTDDDHVFGPGTSWAQTSPPLATLRMGELWYQVGGVTVTHSDQYWGNVIDEARRIYGDSGIVLQDGVVTPADGTAHAGRRLVYGDGAYLPTDGRIAYTRLAPSGQAERFVQNSDGSVQQLGRTGETTGPKIVPDTYRYSPDQRQMVAYKDGKPIYSAPIGSIRGPKGEKTWVQRPDGTFVPAGKEGGTPLVPGAEILEVQPLFPGWVLAKDPEFAVAITLLFVNLRKLLGQGEPQQANLSPTRYHVPNDGAGIDEYGTLKVSFDRLADLYDGVAAQMVAAVSRSAALTKVAREELANAVVVFNGRAAAAAEDDFAAVAAAAHSSLADALQAITDVLTNQQEPGSYQETAYIPSAAGVPAQVALTPEEANKPEAERTSILQRKLAAALGLPSTNDLPGWAKTAAAAGADELSKQLLLRHAPTIGLESATPILPRVGFDGRRLTFGKDVPSLGRHTLPRLPAPSGRWVRGVRALGPVGTIAGIANDAYSGYSDWRDNKVSGGRAIAETGASIGGGLAGGAIAGAVVGSAFGPVGTAVGAGIGAVIGSEVGKRAMKALLSW